MFSLLSENAKSWFGVSIFFKYGMKTIKTFMTGIKATKKY